jgi:hypothetical protein
MKLTNAKNLSELSTRIWSVEYRLKLLRNRKIQCIDWREHAILRFDIIDAKKLHENLVQEYKSIITN